MRMDTCIWYWFGHGLLEIGSESLNVTFTIDECNVEYGFMGVNKGSTRTSLFTVDIQPQKKIHAL